VELNKKFSKKLMAPLREKIMKVVLLILLKVIAGEPSKIL